MVNITETAAEKILTLLIEQGQQDTHGLRIKVVGGGCSGLRYELMFDEPKEDDNEVEAHGVRLFLDEKSSLYLVGSTLDFTDTLMDSGFKIGNPNATNSCGCGESFAV